MNQAMGAGLGEAEFTDLLQDKKSRLLNTNYEPVVYYCVTKSNWRAFTAKATLNRLSGSPISRWKYAYQLPGDCMKVISTWPPSAYELQNRQLLTDATSVNIDFIRLLEEAYWPAWFVRFVVSELVMRCCRGITGDDPSAQMTRENEVALNDAYFQDASQQPNQQIMSDDFTLCRF